MNIEEVLVKAGELAAKDTYEQADVATLDALLTLLYEGAGARVGRVDADRRSEYGAGAAEGERRVHAAGAACDGPRDDSRVEVLRAADPRRAGEGKSGECGRLAGRLQRLVLRNKSRSSWWR